MRKKLLTLAGVALASVLILAACGKSNSSSNSKQILTVATNAEMATLNSTKYSDTTSLEALENTFEGLYRINAKNKPVLAGASSVTTVSYTHLTLPTICSV